MEDARAIVMEFVEIDINIVDVAELRGVFCFECLECVVCHLVDEQEDSSQRAVELFVGGITHVAHKDVGLAMLYDLEANESIDKILEALADITSSRFTAILDVELVMGEEFVGVFEFHVGRKADAHIGVSFPIDGHEVFPDGGNVHVGDVD